MENEREYYLAGGADLEKLKGFIEKRSAAFKLMAETAAKYGGKAVHNGVRVTGLLFDGNAPAGWTPRGSFGVGKFYLPKRDSAERKAAATELENVQLPCGFELHSLFSKDGGVMKEGEGKGFGMRLLFISYEDVAGELLLSIPTGCDFTPDGSGPLKMSEYWALKENGAGE